MKISKNAKRKSFNSALAEIGWHATRREFKRIFQGRKSCAIGKYTMRAGQYVVFYAASVFDARGDLAFRPSTVTHLTILPTGRTVVTREFDF